MPKELIGKFEGKKGLVVASGRCVWDDLYRLGVMGGESNGGYDVMCVCDIVMHYPGKVTHFFSNDRRRFAGWEAIRRDELKREFGQPEYVHCLRKGSSYKWGWPGHGTSTMGATMSMLAMGYNPVVLCGAPMDGTGHYFDPPWKKTNFQNEVKTKNGDLAYWCDIKKQLMGRVFSMSGRTREMLGEPPWIAQSSSP